MVNVYEGVCSLAFSPQGDRLVIGGITNKSHVFRLAHSDRSSECTLQSTIGTST